MKEKRKRIKTFLSLLITSCLLAFTACQKSKLTEELQKIHGRKIEFPESTLSKEKFSIVHYIDSIGCTSCKLKKEQWKMFYDKMRKKGVAANIVFISHPHIYTDVREILFDVQTDNIVIMNDSTNDWFKKNDIPENELFYTLLVNKDKEIVTVGNPTYNENIAHLMFKIMTQ